MRKDVLCIMGPTASGKTGLAIELAESIPCDLISVDSAMVFRGMDVGTAKPDAETLTRFPHALVDIRDPEEKYSAGDFVRDAETVIDSAHSRGRLPLLVGGTMMYFRSLTDGIAELPDSNEILRAEIDAEACRRGWPSLHEELAAADPAAAARINPNDRQRIQRALEVYRTSGTTLSDWQAASRRRRHDYRFIKIALLPQSRAVLHARIAMRLDAMFDNGFVEEVEALSRRPQLTGRHPSMRAVGYRAVWDHVAGRIDLETAQRRALYATRQLAKRQITWLRSESGLLAVDPLESGSSASISAYLEEKLSATKWR